MYFPYHLEVWTKKDEEGILFVFPQFILKLSLTDVLTLSPYFIFHVLPTCCSSNVEDAIALSRKESSTQWSCESCGTVYEYPLPVELIQEEGRWLLRQWGALKLLLETRAEVLSQGIYLQSLEQFLITTATWFSKRKGKMLHGNPMPYLKAFVEAKGEEGELPC